MIVYIANRNLEILGHASTHQDQKYIIVNDSRVEDVENASETLTFDLYYKYSDAKDVQSFMQVGNYLLLYNEAHNDYKAFEVIETEINLIDSYINVYSESAGLDLLNSIADTFYLNYEWVRHLYRTVLGRQGSEKEVEYYIRRLSYGTLNDNECVKMFLWSKEFLETKGGASKTLTQFVQLLYNSYLNRNGSTSEVNWWVNAYTTSKEQLIYISQKSGTKSVNTPSEYVTDNSGKQNGWTTTRPATDKNYPLIFIARQGQLPGGVIHTTPSTNQAEATSAKLLDAIKKEVADGFGNSEEFTKSEFKVGLSKHTIKYFIDRYVKGTGFEVGLNELESKELALEFDQQETVTARLLNLAAYYECEIYFTFKIKGFEITNKYINVVKKRGRDTKIELRLGREVENIRVITSITNLITAIKPIGNVADNADLPTTLSYPKQYSYDDGNDFYVDGEFIKSRKALELWARYDAKTSKGEGHITKLYTSQETDQKKLFTEALAELKAGCQEEINCECTMLRVPDELNVGDKAYLIDDNSELYFQARVLRMETSESNDTRFITLGDYLITNSGISKRVENLAAAFEKLASSRVFYTWIVYADDNQGTNMSLTQEGHNYMGIAVNKLTPAPDLESEDSEFKVEPSMFTWSLLETYTWIAYADDAEGTGISTDIDGKKYMGVAVNQLSKEVDISDPTRFSWSVLSPDATASLHTWVAYADTITGEGISLDRDGKLYIGYSVNRVSEIIDISDPTEFEWSIIETSSEVIDAISNLNETNAEAAARMDALETQNSEAQDKIDTLDAELETKTTALESQIEVLKQENSEMAVAVAELSSKGLTVGTEYQDTKTTISGDGLEIWYQNEAGDDEVIAKFTSDETIIKTLNILGSLAFASHRIEVISKQELTDELNGNTNVTIGTGFLYKRNEDN